MNKNQIILSFTILISLTFGLLMHNLIMRDFSINDTKLADLIPLVSLPILILAFSLALYENLKRKKETRK